jgi:hypothetical protein
MTEWKGWKAIIRDVVIIWLLTGIGSFIIGIATIGSKMPMVAIALSNIILGVIGFCISGCIIKDNRWKHLIIVAVFVWLTSLFNIIFLQASFSNWLFSIIIIFIMMAVGGGLSFLFVKPNRNEL